MSKNKIHTHVSLFSGVGVLDELLAILTTNDWFWNLRCYDTGGFAFLEDTKMAKSIEPEVKNWFAQALSQHKTKYCIEQGTLNIEIESALKAAPSKS